MTWLLRALPAATFVVGLVLGGLLIGLTDNDDGGLSEENVDQAPGASSPTTGSSTTAVLVPAACAEASGEVELAVGLMRDGAAAVRDVQPEELTRVLNSLEDTQTRLDELAQRCSEIDVEPTP